MSIFPKVECFSRPSICRWMLEGLGPWDSGFGCLGFQPNFVNTVGVHMWAYKLRYPCLPGLPHSGPRWGLHGGDFNPTSKPYTSNAWEQSFLAVGEDWAGDQLTKLLKSSSLDVCHKLRQLRCWKAALSELPQRTRHTSLHLAGICSFKRYLFQACTGGLYTMAYVFSHSCCRIQYRPNTYTIWHYYHVSSIRCSYSISGIPSPGTSQAVEEGHWHWWSSQPRGWVLEGFQNAKGLGFGV